MQALVHAYMHMYNLQSFRLCMYVYVQRRAHAHTLPALVQLHAPIQL